MGLVISMRVDRRLGFWTWNVAVPLYLLTVCAIGSWAVPADDIGDRAAITLTVMLTIVAVKFMLGDRIPAINYLTVLDK